MLWQRFAAVKNHRVFIREADAAGTVKHQFTGMVNGIQHAVDCINVN